MTTENDTPSSRAHFVQCRLPADLYEWMRLRAFLTHRSMNSVALAAMGDYRAAIDAGQAKPDKSQAESAGVTKYNVRVDDDLYEWLRTTAFYAHLSINTLVVTSLDRYHAAHKDENPAAV